MTDNKRSLRIAFACLALALLTKGLIALVLLPLISLSYLAIERVSWSKFFKLFDPIGMLIFLAIAAPWHILASLQLPEFAWQYFINEHVLRFLNQRIPNDYHHGPWYFYLPRLLVYIAPWSLFIPTLLKQDAEAPSLKRFLWCWFLIPLLFFTLSQAKGDYYMVIGLPPLILLLAMKIQTVFTGRNTKYLYAVFGVIITTQLLMLTLLTLGAYRTGIETWLTPKLVLEPFLAEPILILTLITLAIAAIGLPIGYKNRQNARTQYLLIASLMLAPIQFLIVDKQKFQAAHSTIFLAETIKKHPAPIFLYRDFEELSSINYYTRQRVAIIDSISSDLYFGQHQAKNSAWFIPLKTFKEKYNHRPFYILSKVGSAPFLKQLAKPMKLCITQKSGRTVLLQQCE